MDAGIVPVYTRRIVPVLIVSLFTLEGCAQQADCSHRTAQDYVAITRSERVADYVRGVTGPSAFLYAGTLAGVNQWTSRPAEWRQGGIGYGRRFRDELAQTIIGNTLQDGLALRLDEDNRYFNSGQRGFARRLGYAITSSVLARRSNGSRTVSVSALGGVAGASLIDQIWQPRSASDVGYAARSFGLAFAFRAGIDIVREFAPRPVETALR